MNLGTMRTSLLSRLGRPSTDTFYTSSILNDFINEALQAIDAEAEWPWSQKNTTFQTAAGVDTYNPPSDWYRTKSLYIPQFNPMDYYPLEEIEQIISTSRPRIYCIYAEQIVLRPFPDVIYTVNHQYYANEPTLVADGDTPVIPAKFHLAIVTKALSIAYQRERSEAAKQAADTEFKEWLERMYGYKRRVTGVSRPRIRPGNDW